MRSNWIGISSAIAPLLASLLLSVLFERGILPNLVLSGSIRADLSAVVSRAGLLLSLGIGLVVILLWRSERIAIEAAAEERRTQNEAHRRFLRRLDHELKNPLTIIRLGITNLQQHPELTADQAGSLERVGVQAQRLQRLLEDLRWLSQLQEGRLDRTRVPLAEVLAEAAGLASDLPGRSHRTVDVSIQQAPWPLGVVHGDRDMLIMAIRNLIDNALKFSSDQDRIEVRATDDGHSAVIEVADTGTGIPEEEIPHVFEELYRGSQAQRVEGSGLGLSLVQRIVNLHGGEVQLRSRAGQGTVISVRLPLMREDEPRRLLAEDLRAV